MHPQSALLLASLHLVLAQDAGPVINTPTSVVQCLPTLITFHGGTPPYTISAIPAGQTGAAPLVELGSQSGDSFTWITNLPGGTATTLQIRDARGVINYSQAITVQSSSDSKCLNGGTTPTPSPSPGPANTTPNPPPGPSTGTGATSPSPSKGANSTTGAQFNATTPATSPNSTSTAGGSSNSTKGPSPFVPPPSTSTPPPTTTSTPVSNNANNAANNAPASAASTLCQQTLLAGLAIAASLSAILA